MTYKELYLKEHPEYRDRIDEVMELYCPMDPSTGKPIMCNYTSISPNLRCGVCWNQEIHETCSCYDIEFDRCSGTKERDECTCGGDKTKCDFYPEKRTKAAEKSDIQERDFKAKELVPIGEEISKGIEQGILEPKTSVNFDDAEFQKKVYDLERLLEKQGDPFKDVAKKRMELDKENLEEIDNDILKEMIKSAEEETSSVKDIEVKPEVDIGGMKKDSVPVYYACPHYDMVSETCIDHMDYERCVCGGDMLICDFFPAKREKAKRMVDAVDKAVNESTIKDSGTRREFSTGAVRDIQEGKGRCDLMPLDVIAAYLGSEDDTVDWVLMNIYNFQEHGQEHYLFTALCTFTHNSDVVWEADYTMFLEVAKHFEAGAVKYGEWNWQKGIPTHCYIDSAVRHYLKYLRGDKDEPHDRAFVWNILCCIWTCKHKPELNDYPRKESKDD